VTGYLPTATVVFLDEIFKASSPILNTLLTVMLERQFDNGLGREPVSLRTLIGASNEAPSSGSELDALYDRFLVRLWVPGVSLWSDFTDLIHPKQSSEFDYQGKLTREDVVALQEEARNVVVPVSVTAFLYLLKW
jgi:MoxR-like ATPase